MNRPRIAPLAIALTLACSASAVSATPVSREVDAGRESIPGSRDERATTSEVVTYEERHAAYTAPESPRVVERYAEPPRESIAVQAGRSTAPARPLAGEWDPRHPHWGHLIDYGLFNRSGPNDFGG